MSRGRHKGAVSVQVNGVEASLSGDRFTAEGVRLVEGTNALVATAVDGQGGTASDAVSVRRDTQRPLVVIESPPDGGAADQ